MLQQYSLTTIKYGLGFVSACVSLSLYILFMFSSFCFQRKRKKVEKRTMSSEEVFQYVCIRSCSYTSTLKGSQLLNECRAGPKVPTGPWPLMTKTANGPCSRTFPLPLVHWTRNCYEKSQAVSWPLPGDKDVFISVGHTPE